MIALGVGGGQLPGDPQLLDRLAAARAPGRRRGGRSRSPRAAASARRFSGVVTGVRRLGDRIAIQDPAQLSALRSQADAGRLLQPRGRGDLPGRQGDADDRRHHRHRAAAALRALPSTAAWARSPSAAAFAIAAIMGPDQVIKTAARKREREYRDGFPDLLDLLVASVEAGLSLDAAVTRVTDELARRYPDLAEHLRVLTLELRAGKSRKDAWTRVRRAARHRRGAQPRHHAAPGRGDGHQPRRDAGGVLRRHALQAHAATPRRRPWRCRRR